MCTRVVLELHVHVHEELTFGGLRIAMYITITTFWVTHFLDSYVCTRTRKISLVTIGTSQSVLARGVDSFQG